MQQIVFLKVHKTGSSTMANILQRYGHSHDLNFALPRKARGAIRYNYFGDVGGTLEAAGVRGSRADRKQYNILYNHVIFNYTAFQLLFPRNSPKTTYLTLIRRPEAQFQSALLFFLHDEIFTAATANFRGYLKNPRLYEPNNTYLSFTDNRQALDLGVPPSRVRNFRYVRTYIKLLDRAFDLVMITEMFDESLIIMKRMLNMTTKDIIYIQKNKAYQKFSFQFTKTDHVLLERWLLADSMIYTHFRQKILRHLEGDPSIEQEAEWFKTVLHQTQAFCSGNDSRSHMNVNGGPWSQAFSVTSLDCVYMKLGELDFLDKLVHGSRH